MCAPENLQNLQHNLWTEINDMTRSKERSSDIAKLVKKELKMTGPFDVLFFKDNSE